MLLEVQHVRKEFQNRTHALTDASFSVSQGDFVSVIGPSGAGKTTLFRILNGSLRCDGGAILVNGVHFESADRRTRRAIQTTIGTIYQDFALVENATCRQNVLNACLPDMAFLPAVCGFFGKERVAEADALLDRVGLADKVHEPVKNLSGGQKQRVAIARALATDPKVLLCDEATSALDPTTTNSILALLKELNQKLGVTVVIITHQMSVIEEICTRVAILDGGEVAEEGRVEDIFAHPATDAARRLVYPGGVSAKQYPAGTRAVRVSFNGGTVYDPLIASLAIDCGVKVTILGADTRTIDGKAFGTMLLLLPDDPNEAAKALSYIRSQPNITAEEVEYHA